MKRKQDFYPGQLCLFDRYNYTAMKGANSITMVSIVRPYKKSLFNIHNEWMVFVPGTQEVIVVPESFLCPAPTVEQLQNLESVIMIRNPVNLPEFTVSDVSNVRKAIAILEEHKAIYNKDATQSIDSINETIKGLNKLLLKFKFYSRMNVKERVLNLGRISSTPYEDNGIKKEEYDEDDV